MTQLNEPIDSPVAPVHSARWAGWVVFAAIMLVVTGSINLIQGLVALFNDGYFVVRSGDELMLADFTTWGVVMLVWGALLVGAGLSLAIGHGWARWFAVLVACLSIIVQIGFLAAYPIWTVVIVALDVIVVFALTAHWDDARADL